MHNVDLDALNQKFAIAGHLSFRPGLGGLPVADIKNAHASAVVSLYGGHILSYDPHDQKPVLWLSRRSRYEVGQPIRGGIPVCWPWFAGHPTDPAKPSHGFARISPWTALGAETTGKGATRLRLGLTDSQATRALWPHPFRLEIVITAGPQLQVDLLVRNPGEQAFTYTGALHTYFSVSDVTDIVIGGLEGATYLDKVGGSQQKVQSGPITIDQETDRIYLDTEADCVIEDPGWNRRIHIAKTGSRSTVVWNPWIDKAAAMPDFGDEEYPGMVCIETANAAADRVTVKPNSEHHLRAVISVQAAAS